MRKIVSVTLATLLAFAPVVSIRADVYHATPKLVIILVIDQFRGDYLDRYRDDFKTPSGFNLFLKRGAYFPGCYYDYVNTETAPGHSTIGTGAYSNGHGIALNQWWDLSRSASHAVSSVEDERYEIVGDHTAADVGASPRNELASTLGDEVVLASRGQSKLFGISLKDRAAILTSGHASNGAFWLDHASGHFVSSTYWGPSLPAWTQAFNSGPRTQQAIAEAHARPGYFYDDVGATPASVNYLLDFAQALIAGEQLGTHATTDVLTISISSTDILGHKVGPDAPEQRAMIDAIDVDLNAFFTWLDKHIDGGMSNVWVSLTGDHGIGPTIDASAAARMPASVFDMNKVYASLNASLNAKYSPGQSLKYILPNVQPALTLDPRPFTDAKVSEAEAEQTVADLLPGAFASSVPPAPTGAVRLPPRPVIRHAYPKTQILAGQLPATPEGRMILNSASPYGGWVRPLFRRHVRPGSRHRNQPLHPLLLRPPRSARLLRLALPHRHLPAAGRARRYRHHLRRPSPRQPTNRRRRQRPHLRPQTLTGVPHDHLRASEGYRGVIHFQPSPQPAYNQPMPKGPDMRVQIAGVELASPIVAASGTFGYGVEFEEIVSLNRIGAFVTKGLSAHPMPGNPAPRIVETASGMLNAIGLQNMGVRAFIEQKLPRLRQIPGAVTIANIFGFTIPDCLEVIEALNDAPGIALYELNASCPKYLTRRHGLRHRPPPPRGAHPPHRTRLRPAPHRQALPKRHLHRSDGQGRAGLRRPGHLPRQHLPLHGHRRRNPPPPHRQRHRRPQRPGHQTHRPAHGLRSRQSRAHSHPGHGRASSPPKTPSSSSSPGPPPSR